MTQENLIIEFFCRVDDFMPNLRFGEQRIFYLSLTEFTYDFARACYELLDMVILVYEPKTISE